MSDGFAEATAGLVGPDGQPLGQVSSEHGPVQGLMWGVAFLFLEQDVVGMVHLDPADVEVVDVNVGGSEEGGVQMLLMRGRPGSSGHSFVKGWDKVPGLAADLLRARLDWAAQIAAVEAGAECQHPVWADSPEVGVSICVMCGSLQPLVEEGGDGDG